MKNTKKISGYAMAALVILSLQACPVGLDYPLDDSAKSEMNKSLIGTWKISEDVEEPEISEVTFEKNDEHTYTIEIVPGPSFMGEGTSFIGWIVEMNGRQFMVAQDIGDGLNYHYSFEVNKKALTTWDISLLIGGVDAVTSTAALQDAVKESMKSEEFLSGEQKWVKE
ncbi:MAG: hypothetical protein SH856_01450 [Flavobacteriales bacterium]|nr:hypothetical protein [Flavobacteriales bacterium]